jgi:hypothetical protein
MSNIKNCWQKDLNIIRGSVAPISCTLIGLDKETNMAEHQILGAESPPEHCRHDR